MQNKLTNEILFHIYSNIGLVVPTKISLQSNEYLLPQSLELEGGGKLNLWGSEVSINSSKLELLLAELTEDDREKEYVLVVKLEDCPAYGCYLLLESTVVDKNVPRHGKIFFSLEKTHWLPTSIYLQASFLAGMEQLKEVPSFWDKLNSETSLVSEMKSLITALFELEDEE